MLKARQIIKICLAYQKYRADYLKFIYKIVE